jgi:hypothetical protein
MKRKVMRTLIAGLIMLSAMVILTTPALGINLWVVPETPTGYYENYDGNDDFVLEDVSIKDINMGTSFSGNISVFYQEGTTYLAEDVYIKFYVKDASNIYNITIGTAQRIERTPPNIIDPNPDSNASVQTLNFVPVDRDNPVPEGFGVSYLVGDIPYSGGPSVTGNPENGTFNPDNASYYVRVPFTINFNNIPDLGFALYVYAENQLHGKYAAKTVYSHDGTYQHVPEFSTIALPIAAILGIMFILQSRRRKED